MLRSSINQEDRVILLTLGDISKNFKLNVNPELRNLKTKAELISHLQAQGTLSDDDRILLAALRFSNTFESAVNSGENDDLTLSNINLNCISTLILNKFNGNLQENINVLGQFKSGTDTAIV